MHGDARFAGKAEGAPGMYDDDGDVGTRSHVLDDGAQVGMRIETIEYDAERAAAGLAALMPAFGMQCLIEARFDVGDRLAWIAVNPQECVIGLESSGVLCRLQDARASHPGGCP
jgi:hypothetical protein